MKIQAQSNSKECGLIILQAFFRYFYKRKISLEFLREQAIFSKNGISIDELERIAKLYYLNLDSYKGDISGIKSLEIIKPIAALVNKNGYEHIVIIKRKKAGRLLILDPIGAERYELTLEEFSNYFLGIILVFKPLKSRYQALKILKNRKVKKPISYSFWLEIFSAIINFFILFLGFLSSLYLRVILERINSYKDINNLILLVTFFIFLFIIYAIIIYLKDVNNLRLFTFLRRGLFKKYLNKLFFLKRSNAEKFSNFDLLKRLDLVSKVSLKKSQGNLNFLSDLLVLSLIFLILFILEKRIAMVLMFIFLFYLIFIFIINKIKSREKEVNFTKNNEFFNSNLDLIFSIGYSGGYLREKYLTKKCLENLKQVEKLENKIIKKESLSTNFFYLLGNFLPLISVTIGLFSVFSNLLVINDLFLILSLTIFLNILIQNIFRGLISFSDLRKEQEMLNFFLDDSKEISLKKMIVIEKVKSIFIKNIRIKSNKNLIIENILIKENIILSGRVGIGKSLLMQTLMLKKKYFGELFVNNKNLKEVNKEVLREKIIYISDNDYIPNLTLWEFLTLKDKYLEKSFLKSIKILNLQKLFLRNNIFLDKALGFNGSELSSGQRQIVRILQLFVVNYDVICLDELFENLDTWSFNFLKEKLLIFQNKSIFIETSHNNRFIFSDSRRLELEKFIA